MQTEIPPRRVRRRNVLLLLLSYPVVSALSYVTLRDTGWFAIAHLTSTVLILWLLGVARVGRVGRAIADDVDAKLDERQLALRNAAYLDAYRLVSAIVLLGVIWIAVGTDKGFWWIPSSYDEWNIVFWGLFLYTTSLPSALLAWREPDRLEEGEFARAV